MVCGGADVVDVFFVEVLVVAGGGGVLVVCGVVCVLVLVGVFEVAGFVLVVNLRVEDEECVFASAVILREEEDCVDVALAEAVLETLRRVTLKREAVDCARAVRDAELAVEIARAVSESVDTDTETATFAGAVVELAAAVVDALVDAVPRAPDLYVKLSDVKLEGDKNHVRANATRLGHDGAQGISLRDGHHGTPAVGAHSKPWPSPLPLASLDAVRQTLISFSASRASFDTGEEGKEKGKGEEKIHQAIHCEISKDGSDTVNECD